MDLVAPVDSAGDVSDEYTCCPGSPGADDADAAASSDVVGIVWYMAGTEYEDEDVSPEVSTAVENAY